MLCEQPTRKNLGMVTCLLTMYAVAAVLTTYPLSTHMDSHLLGNTDDIILHYWNSWWVQQALQQGQVVWQSTAMFYPNGLSLVTHNIAWLNALWYALVEPMIGGVAAFNSGLLINLVACGLATALLVHDLTGRWESAALAGLIYQTWPYRLHQLSHPNLVSTQFIPLFLLFLMRTLRNKRWRDALLAGLMYALVGYTRWQLLIPATMMGLICVLALWREWLQKRPWVDLLRLTVAGAIAVALLAPPLYLLYQQQSSDSAASLMREGEEETMQTDLASYAIPSEWHWLLGDVTTPLYERFYADHLTPQRRYPAYLGIVATLFALVALIKRPRQALPWMIMAGLLVALALGPVLRFNGQLLPQMPMPYSLLAKTELVRLMRRPTRYNMFMALPMAIMAALGAEILLGRVRSQRWRVAVTAGLCVLVMVEYLAVPIPIEAAEIGSPYLDVMAEESGYEAVVNLPFDDLKAKIYMWEQITHGKEIVQGNVSRMPGNAYEYIESVPLLASLNQYDEVSPHLTDISAQLETLAQDGIGRIIIHKNLVGKDRVEHWRRYLVIEPLYEDDDLLVYDTTPDLSKTFERSPTIADGLGIADRVVASEKARLGSRIEVDIAWAFDRTLDTIYALSLRLIDHEGNTWVDKRYPLCQENGQAKLPQDRLIWSYYYLPIPAYLEPGEYAVAIAAIDPITGQYAQQACVLEDVVLQSSSRASYQACFGEQLYLDQASISQDERHLKCELTWMASRRMRTDYTVFVHVFDLATGVPVAQDDSMPRRGAFPTRFWWPGETLEDRFDIALDGVPAGTYGLCVGVYDAATGQRLDAIDGDGAPLVDGRVVLQSQVIVEDD